MTKMNKEPEEPSPAKKSAREQSPPRNDNKSAANGNGNKNGFITRLLNLFTGKPDSTLRETIEEYIEEPNFDGVNSISSQEKALISNILKLRGLTVVDVMIPRADIVAIDVSTSQEELLSLLAEKQYSRLPVYKGNLDKTLGTIHIKDILAALAKGKDITVKPLVRECPIVSPSLHVLDLLLQMKESRKHMAFVVDEYGGIDGLVTINDVIENIVGEIEDEHDPDNHAALDIQDDGSIIADARVYLDEFEQQFGEMLSAEEREENDTLGGLVFHIAGRVPARGEILTHASGMAFEILEADKRRVNRLAIRNIPS
jgi:magnesium and cobalt transporter